VWRLPSAVLDLAASPDSKPPPKPRKKTEKRVERERRVESGEPVRRFAAEIGMVEQTLVNRLRALGHERPAGRGVWRLPWSVLTNAANAADGLRESFEEASARTGHSVSDLRLWLDEARELEASWTPHGYRLLPAAVDRVIAGRGTYGRVPDRRQNPSLSPSEIDLIRAMVRASRILRGLDW